MFINLDKELKLLSKKCLENQDITQKYLVAESGNRVMNDAFKQIQNKKKSKLHYCKKCSKKFLSFPALKEHSKKQHGFQPSQDGVKRQRGRPRRDVVKPSDQYLQWEQQQIQLPSKPKRPTSLMTFNTSCQSMQQFQQCLLPDRRDYNSAITLLFDRKRLDSQLEEAYIRKTLEEIQKNEEEQQDFYLQKDQSVSCLLTAFLVNAAQFANDEFLKVMIVFVKAIYYYIDNYGREDLIKRLTINEYGLIPPVLENKKFHELMKIESFPLVLNEIIQFLPEFLQDFPVGYAARLLKDICDWSYKECGGFQVFYDI